MGYYIVDQIPDADDVEVATLMAKLDALKPPDERVDIWLGKAKDCMAAAMCAQFTGILHVVNTAQKAFGYHQPLRIHLCGKWWNDAGLRDIKYYFERMAATKVMDIEFVTE